MVASDIISQILQRYKVLCSKYPLSSRWEASGYTQAPVPVTNVVPFSTKSPAFSMIQENTPFFPGEAGHVFCSYYPLNGTGYIIGCVMVLKSTLFLNAL